MLNNGNTLHFINRVDNSNCGDSLVCPLLYYYDFFKRYRIKRHDIRFIDFDSISSTDVVIVGGGGLFDYAEFTNRAINRLLDTGASVVAWSPGFNTHSEYSNSFQTAINFDRFAIAAVRDYSNAYGLPYLPDVTCKLPGLQKKYTVRRAYGVAQHKDYEIKGLDLFLDQEYDTITNAHKIDEILQFIGESEIVLSNSYHMLYWATLMGKKTICIDPFSSKFYSYQYKPAYFSPQTDNFSDCVNKAQRYNILDACIEANDAFFNRVKALIEDKLTPVSNDWFLLESVTQEAIGESKYRESILRNGDALQSQLYIDTGNGFHEECKLVTINNVLGDAFHTVTFDLKRFESIKALRFDPIEGYNCEVQIISAKSEAGDVKLAPFSSVRIDDCDRFLTTDPQYFTQSPCTGFLEIVFKLRLLTHQETEQNIYTYIGWQIGRIEERDRLLAQQTKQIAEKDALLAQQADQIVQNQTLLEAKMAQIRDMDVQLEHNAVQIDQYKAETIQKNALLNQQAEQIQRLYQSSSWKLTAPLRAIARFFRRLLKGMQ